MLTFSLALPLLSAYFLLILIIVNRLCRFSQEDSNCQPSQGTTTVTQGPLYL